MQQHVPFPVCGGSERGIELEKSFPFHARLNQYRLSSESGAYYPSLRPYTRDTLDPNLRAS